MLPFDRRPWARSVATAVIFLSFVSAVAVLFYFRSIDSLHISEFVGVFLLLLTVVPPNVAILMRKPGESQEAETSLHPSRTTVR